MLVNSARLGAYLSLVGRRQSRFPKVVSLCSTWCCLFALLAISGNGSRQQQQQQFLSAVGRRVSSAQWGVRFPPWRQQSGSAPVRNSRPNYRSTAAVSSAGRWQNGVVIFLVDRTLAPFRSVIGRAMREIEASTCIRFRQRRNERDYVLMVNGKGCHSKVGRTGGQQLLSLGPGCHDVGSTLHELSHAIGLYHEQSRWDRDYYLNIIWQNIDPKMYDQFQKIPASSYRPATGFAYDSIMIYGSKAFSKNGLNTMVPRDSRARIMESHFKSRLAQSDIININSLYAC